MTASPYSATQKTFLLFCFAAFLLTGCSTFSSDKKKPLPGERVSVLDMQRHIEPDNPVLGAEGFIAPPPWKNDFWPQPGGYSGHAMQHVALNAGALKQIWTAKIGDGATDRMPLTAQPIVADGRIFTVDISAMLSAFSVKDGHRLWQVSIGTPSKHEAVIGGGISYSGGHLYLTNGYNEVLSVNPADGKIIWRVRIASPSRAAPTVLDDKLYITTLDNHLYAMHAADGSILWDYTGIDATAGLVGAASPAADGDIVIPAFSSGEVYALRAGNGDVIWSENLSAASGITGGLSGLSDIRGLPVLDKGVVFAVSFDGRLAAIDERTGNRLWQRDIGSSETPWLAGNHLFLLSTDNELVGLGRDNGTIHWVLPLPRFEKPADHKGPLFWTSPILAGGRLIIAGTDGDMVEVTPDTGKIIRTTHVDHPVTVDPIVAGGTLYLLGDDGTLMAYQ